MNRPPVLVVTRRTTRKHKYINYVGEFHLELLIRLETLPMMVPVVDGTLRCLPQYMQEMSGLLLVEGEDIEPRRFKSRRANYQYLEGTHRLKDELEIRLIRHALRQRLPVLGICRGSQLINIACGGTLYGDVRKEKKSQLRHINYGDDYDTYRHAVDILPETPLAYWYRQPRINVNSYHHQGIRDLARRFKPMAHATDGLIEAYYDPKVPFLVGLQFHPERMLPDYPGNLRVWKEFTDAVHQAAQR